MSSAVRHLALVSSVALCLFGLTHNLGGYALLDPDEGRNAEVAREMTASGDYVLPHLNGLPYLDKPVLYFAVGALSIKLFGENAVAARLPSLLFTLATITLVGWFARRIFGRDAVLTAAIATAATPFTLAYARIVIFDSALTFFVVLALMSFYLAVDERLSAEAKEGGATPESWTALAWVAMAFGVLTKGPIAIAIPLMIAIPFAARYRALRSVADPIALVLFTAIVLPWVFAVTRRVPDFMEYALVTETLRRFSTTELERTGPVWYFLAIFPTATLPWSLVLLGACRKPFAALRNLREMDRRVVFLLLWVLLPLVFFTLSQSKRPQYVLPLVPAVALLVAAAWQNGSARFPGARWGSAGLVLLGTFFIGASGSIENMVPASAYIAAAIKPTALILGSACLLSGLIAWFAQHHRVALFLVFSVPVAAIPVSSHSLMREIGHERSAAQLAGAIIGSAGNGVRVIGVEAFPPSLPFYLDNPILVASEDGEVLTSNYLMRHVSDHRGFGSTWRSIDWWQEALLTCTEPTVFVVRSDDGENRDALSHLDMIMETRKYVAFGPCGLETLAATDR